MGFNVTSKRINSLRQWLLPIIRGAAGCFVESYQANSATISGLDTNYYIRAPALQLAGEFDVPGEFVVNSSWKARYGHDENTRRTRLLNALRSDGYVPDTSKQAIDRLDIIDAVCIGLFSLQKQG